MQHGGMWTGEIRTSGVTQIDLITDKNYCPVGSGVHVEITWTNRKGDSAIVKTPVSQISRTD